MKIHGTGCSLVDNLYTPIDFYSDHYMKWLARKEFDAGIITGGLVFGDNLEKEAGVKYADIIAEITGDMQPQRNVGGPSVVALLHMSQITDMKEVEISYYGARSDDETGKYLKEKLSRFNINIDNYIVTDGNTPFTDVLSDPSYNNNNGERTFINYIGAAGRIAGRDLPASFFEADILVFGGTALTPGIHDDLSQVLKRGRDSGCINFVNTVYDFRNQRRNPEKPWPLVSREEDFRLIDLLIADNEEAVRISGKPDKREAARFFLSKGVRSGIITHGSEDITCFSNGNFFSEEGIFTMPVSREAGARMKAMPSGKADTTGCGDNFAGGVYASVVRQLSESPGNVPSLRKAALMGIVSGGFAGLYLGGVYYEQYRNEKAEKLKPLIESYGRQTGVKYE